MRPRAVVNIARADSDSLIGGTTVARRMHEVADQRGVGVEVFIFAGAAREAYLRYAAEGATFVSI
jgi:hypothetical protein